MGVNRVWASLVRARQHDQRIRGEPAAESCVLRRHQLCIQR